MYRSDSIETTYGCCPGLKMQISGHFLRPGHLGQLAKILTDPEAGIFGKKVAW